MLKLYLKIETCATLVPLLKFWNLPVWRLRVASCELRGKDYKSSFGIPGEILPATRLRHGAPLNPQDHDKFLCFSPQPATRNPQLATFFYHNPQPVIRSMFLTGIKGPGNYYFFCEKFG